MTRTRVSTTVDTQLLADARERTHGPTDAALLDEALRALVQQLPVRGDRCLVRGLRRPTHRRTRRVGRPRGLSTRCRRLVSAVPRPGRGVVVRARRPSGADRSSCCHATRRSSGSGARSSAPCTTTIRGLASEVVLEPGEDPVDRPIRGEPRLDRERLAGRSRGATGHARRRADASAVARHSKLPSTAAEPPDRSPSGRCVEGSDHSEQPRIGPAGTAGRPSDERRGRSEVRQHQRRSPLAGHLGPVDHDPPRHADGIQGSRGRDDGGGPHAHAALGRPSGTRGGIRVLRWRPRPAASATPPWRRSGREPRPPTGPVPLRRGQPGR